MLGKEFKRAMNCVRVSKPEVRNIFFSIYILLSEFILYLRSFVINLKIYCKYIEQTKLIEVFYDSKIKDL